MDELMNSMVDAIISLTEVLFDLGKECNNALENYNCQNELQLLSEFGKLTTSSDYERKQELQMSECGELTTSSDYERKQELLMSECQKLTHAFRTITQQVWELTMALRANEVETGNIATLSLALPLPEWAGALSVNAVQTERCNMAESPAPPLPEVTVEYNMAALDETVEQQHGCACIAPGFCLTRGPK